MWEGRHNVSGNDTIKKTISYKIMRNCLLCRDCCWYLHHRGPRLCWKVDDISHSNTDRSPACVTVGFINEQVNEPINCLCLSSQISPGGGFQLNSSILQSGQSRQPSPGLAWFVYSALNTEIWYFDFWHLNILNRIFTVCVSVWPHISIFKLE